VVAAAPAEARSGPQAVLVVAWLRNERGALAGLKTTSYAENARALAHARREGADEAVFANTAGNLCEGTGSNVFVVVDGRLITPPLSAGCLAGVTRDLVLESSEAREEDLPISRFNAADVEEAFLTSTMREVAPIHTINGEPQMACPGPLTAAAREAFEKLAAAGDEP
jgi:branched-chain amino acid aminotransferase